MTPFRLDGQRILITGGGSGLGFGMAKAMVEAGAQVIITGRRKDVLQDAVRQLGENVNFIINDLCELDKIPAFVKKIELDFGPIDCLVNNAGINLKKPTLNVTNEEFQKVIHLNLNAVFALTRECLTYMVKRNKGNILMISSMAAMYGLDRVAAYAASKAGVNAMIFGFCTEFASKGIRINTIAPGFIESDMFIEAMKGDPERFSKILGRTPVKSLGKPEDIGYAAVFLASDAARYITGITLPVDGGNSIGF